MWSLDRVGKAVGQMTCAQVATLVAAGFGAVGSLVLYLNTYALQPIQGGFAGPGTREYTAEVKAHNQRRTRWNRLGIGFLLVGFLIQAVSVFLN